MEIIVNKHYILTNEQRFDNLSLDLALVMPEC